MDRRSDRYHDDRRRDGRRDDRYDDRRDDRDRSRDYRRERDYNSRDSRDSGRDRDYGNDRSGGRSGGRFEDSDWRQRAPPPPPPSSSGRSRDIVPPPPAVEMPPSMMGVGPQPPPPPAEDLMPKREKRDPLSLDQLIARREEAIVAASKPKFLTKEERAAEAIRRREAEVAASRQNVEELREKRVRIFEQGRDELRYGGASSSSSSSSYHRRGEKEKPKEEPKDADMEAIREAYLGAEKKKRKIRKMNEKKVVFDWDVSEDTSADRNPIYANRHHAQMFGRGHVAGIDVKEQKKNALFYRQFLKERQSEEEARRMREREEETRAKERKQAHDDRHWTEKELNAMTKRDWRIAREDWNITTKGGAVPHPLRSWSESDLPYQILRIINDLGYEEPTPIQRQAIPIGMANRDLIGLAETGGGKTAAFVLPLICWILDLPAESRSVESSPFAIIMAPTRELAVQIEEETRKFADKLGITVVSIIGGISETEQASKLRNGCDIVIATPGRMLANLMDHSMSLDRCTYVVLDEADRMIDMHFEEDLQKILKFLPVTNEKPIEEEGKDYSNIAHLSADQRYRQTAMFSATMPASVERLAHAYLRRPATVQIGTVGRPVDRIVQHVELIPAPAKGKRLLALLGALTPPVIVFVNHIKAADTLAKSLEGKGFTVAVLHGKKTQDQRSAAIEGIKKKGKQILVATDVAARGLDISDVSAVINFDCAKTIEDYTHRIGRTGRAGKEGVAYTFLTEDDTDIYFELRKFLESSPVSQVPAALANHAASKAPRPERQMK